MLLQYYNPKLWSWFWFAEYKKYLELVEKDRRGY